VLSTLLEITTCVALLAVTIKVEEVPCVIEVGVELIVTVGAGAEVTVIVAATAVVVPPAPVAVAV
jgi:hypothetical protein